MDWGEESSSQAWSTGVGFGARAVLEGGSSVETKGHDWLGGPAWWGKESEWKCSGGAVMGVRFPQRVLPTPADLG